MFNSFNIKQKRIIIIVAIIIAVGIMYYIYNNASNKIEISNEEMLVQKNVVLEENKREKEEIVIHITGSVKVPGIVMLEEGARIKDAIEAAGGLTEDADISKLNLAYVLEDGTKVKIPSIKEDLDGDEIISQESGENVIEEEENKTSSKKKSTININKATQEEFENLPGIGPSLAKKIIDYRKENGNFQNSEDIKSVNGIGESKYENIKSYIYVK